MYRADSWNLCPTQSNSTDKVEEDVPLRHGGYIICMPLHNVSQDLRELVILLQVPHGWMIRQPIERLLERLCSLGDVGVGPYDERQALQ